MLTPGVVREKPEAAPMAGSNDPVFGRILNPIERVKREASDNNSSFMSQILAKERELAKIRIRRSGENVRNVVEIGDIHFLNKRFTKARDAYRRAITLDGQSVDAYRKLVNSYIAVGNLDAASDTYKRLIKVDPNPEFQHELILLRLAMSLGDDEALKLLGSDIKKLAADNSSNTHIQNTYGMFLGFIMQKHDEAKPFYDKSIALDPANFHAINNLGVYYIAKGNLDKAISCYKKAIEINPKYESGYQNIAAVYIKQEKYAQALAVLRSAIDNKAEITDVWVHKIGWLLIMLENYDEAVKWHKKKIKEEPENDYLLNNLAFCYQMQGKLDKAKEYYTSAIECFETKLSTPGFIADIRSINPYKNLMVLADKRNEDKLVDSTAKRLLRIDPTNPMALFFRGQAQQKMKRYNFARECFEKSIEINPNAIEPYINLAFIYEAIDKEYQKAIDLLEGAPFSKTDIALIANNLAYAYTKNGELDKAKQVLSKAKFKDNPSLNATKGLIELYENNFKKAEQLYSKAIEAVQYKEKKFAQQVWDYEQAYYWLNNNDIELAAKKVKDALEPGDVSYAYSMTKELGKRLRPLARAASLR